MNNFYRINEPVVVSAVGKKRKPSKSNHLREEIKKTRHSGGGKMPAVACAHTTASHFCHADTLTSGDLLRNFQLFYSKSTKTEQDQAIFQLIKFSGDVPRLTTAICRMGRSQTNTIC